MRRNPRMEALPRRSRQLLDEASYYTCIMDCRLVAFLWRCRNGYAGRVYKVFHRGFDCSEPSILVEEGCLLAVKGPASREAEGSIGGEGLVYATKLGDMLIAVSECESLGKAAGLLDCGDGPEGPRYVCYDSYQDLGEDLLEALRG